MSKMNNEFINLLNTSKEVAETKIDLMIGDWDLEAETFPQRLYKFLTAIEVEVGLYPVLEEHRKKLLVELEERAV